MSEVDNWTSLLPDPRTPAFIMQKLIVSDSARSVAFYREAIGMTVLFRLEAPGLPFNEILMGFEEDPAGARVILASALHEGVTPGMAPYGTPFPTGVPFANIVMQSPDVAALLTRVEKMGGSLAMPPYRIDLPGSNGALLAFAQDPDGHVLEFFQFTPFDDSLPEFDIAAPDEGLLKLFGAPPAS